MRILVLTSAVLVLACRSTTSAPVDPKNATYAIEKRQVTLSDGLFEVPAAPGSAAKATTRLDKSAPGDLNADGNPDAAVILTVTGGGSGTFSYVSSLLGAGSDKADSTNAIVLGDRIVVEALKVDGGKISVDVLDRRAGEPFTTAPTVKAIRIFQLSGRTLTEVH